ncbi:2-amino-4-hydroxy-6-hydroxymethyldihydropteridine diphosphokinase [Saliniradius amylolyticus]|uniref:2-amino-4-hydroxy-6-hydroxymethyldihydropteridine pyrophosphokinase n=1 Tax=Saliniradius amylolyticus TaxID=2183582 RepID=A0A2S2E1F7_9ALTE|nr:2-amino-4-hydroxy-6-hydroxymethyldihydropteridine diphosphokinase [Saliniradius amylolyticus]AWL10867.1 2-amino-4-hydroxy-6-hydroxymethyldihydropteridine diphosphokinase [Saliniradius amylolyticus]
MDIYIGLGSNLDAPKQQLLTAFNTLAQHPDMRLVDTSSLYTSLPMGPQDQPDYVNAVACLQSKLDPLMLLRALQDIEWQQGRVRKDERWGARTLDLDILLYGQQVIKSPELIVPHYGMQDREFVVHPLMEIAPELQLPDGQALADVAHRCPKMGLRVLCPRAEVWQFVTESV